MRLIDACALNRNVDCCYFESSKDYYTICEQITQAPTVDAVEVVRCKDCIYYHKKLGIGFGKCSKCTLMPYPEDFCSYGERKDNETTKSL